MIRTYRLWTTIVAIVALVAFVGPGVTPALAKAHHHHSGQKMLGNKIKDNGEHVIHKQGEQTITVTFVDYETIDGIRFEKEIHRTTGDPRFDAVIKFTKTVINPPLSAAFFSDAPTFESAPTLPLACSPQLQRGALPYATLPAVC